MSTAVQVDTIRLRGRLRDGSALKVLPSVTCSRTFDPATGDRQLVERAAFDVLASGARYGVDLQHGEAPEGWVEFSAPKIATGSNVYALPLGEAVEVARAVVAEAGPVLGWLDPFERLRVQRLDLDRDFEDVDQADALLGALARVRAPYSPKTRLYPDAERSGAVTLTRGPAARWLATLYGKHGESLHRLRHCRPEDRAAIEKDVRDSEGRLRFELRLRPDVLGECRTVADLADAAPLAALRRRYFDRVGYGREVSGMNRAVEMVMGAEADMRQDRRLALLGWLVCEGQGLSPQLHRNNTAKYRRACEELGVAAVDLEAVAKSAVVLDFDRGRMMRSA